MSDYVACNICESNTPAALTLPDEQAGGGAVLCLMCASGLEAVERELGSVDRMVLGEAARAVAQVLGEESDSEATVDPTAQLIAEYRSRLTSFTNG